MPLFAAAFSGPAWGQEMCIRDRIMLSMFTQHTSDTRTIIMGVQGRYFIPIFPLLFISLNNQVLVYRKHIENVLLLIAVFLQSVTVLTIINMTN